MDDNTMDKLKSLLNNENIPDELKSILSNLNSNNNNNTKNTSSISPDTINNLMSMLKNNKNSNSNTNSNPESDSYTDTNIDFETIMKLKNMMDKMNSKDDPRSKLLISLKPYLKESRKNKVDQYIQFLNMSKVFNIFSKGDKKNEI